MLREQSQLEDAQGSESRSGGQLAGSDALYSPVGDDGYPRPLCGHKTGKIDKELLQYMKDHGYDPARYIESHWTELAPKLTGRMHFYVGDYGQLVCEPHTWYPMSTTDLVRSTIRQ